MTEGRAWLDEALRRLEDAEAPFSAPPADLPGPDDDLAALLQRPVTTPDGPPEPADFNDCATRTRNLAREMSGASEAVFLNARLIMHLRRVPPAAGTRTLFFRLWDQMGAMLARELPTRWRVSAAQTFADHGRTETERRLGGEVALLFGLVKLYESERRFSGLGPGQIFPARTPAQAALPLGLDPFALRRGDLPQNLVARLWRQVRTDPAEPMALLAAALLVDLAASDATVISRLAAMRSRQNDTRR